MLFKHSVLYQRPKTRGPSPAFKDKLDVSKLLYTPYQTPLAGKHNAEASFEILGTQNLQLSDKELEKSSLIEDSNVPNIDIQTNVMAFEQLPKKKKRKIKKRSKYFSPINQRMANFSPANFAPAQTL